MGFRRFNAAVFSPARPTAAGALALLLLAGLGAPRAAMAAVPLPPAVRPCLTNDLPAGYGTFLLIKSAAFQQDGAGLPAELATASGYGAMELVPPAAYSISNALAAGPGNTRIPLVHGSDGVSTWTNGYPSEAVLNSTLAAGAWNTSFQLSFTNGDTFVGFFPFTVASAAPPVPQVANLAAGQAINPAAPFTLSWTPWVGGSTNDRISLEIVDAAGTRVYSAATDCAGAVSLAPGATAAEIPAGTLPGGRTFTGYLAFSTPLFDTEDAASLLLQRGYHARVTRFTLQTTGSSGGTPGEFQQPRIAGTNLVFTLSGSPGSTHVIQSTPDFITWTEERSVTLGATGSAEVLIPLPANGQPRFYRALATGGGEPEPEPGEAAQLRLVLAANGVLDLTVTGTAGATYEIQATTNYLAWAALTNVTLAAGSTSTVARIEVPAGTAFLVLRALSAGAPPTPSNKQPQLGLGTAANGMRLDLTGGDAARTYAVEKVTALGGPWGATPLSVTTDASGAGSVMVTPDAAEPNAFFRAVRR